jgi:hypothetical protein
LGIPDEDLQFDDLLADSGLNIWQENVLYLVSTVPRGENAELAEAGVAPGTLSKRKKREHVLDKTYQA